MKRIQKSALVLAFLFSAASCFGEGEKKSAPTHAEAAVVMVKYAGFFDRYIDPRASMGECVSFLNERGIYFGLLEVLNGSEFTEKDSARVLGQIDLLLSGEAEFSMGKVKLPKGVASWREFCIMNGVDYVTGHKVIAIEVDRLRELLD